MIYYIILSYIIVYYSILDYIHYIIYMIYYIYYIILLHVIYININSVHRINPKHILLHVHMISYVLSLSVPSGFVSDVTEAHIHDRCHALSLDLPGRSGTCGICRSQGHGVSGDPHGDVP
jgi:hypothetical protein